jgi:hypothetical protein
MNENVKTYIPYGAAALGAVLGNVLYKKYPKFGTAGRLLAIGLGAVSGYYISDKIVGDDSDDFRNAAGGNCKKKACEENCRAGGQFGVTGICIDNRCVCVDGGVIPTNQIRIPNNSASLNATRNFYNAVSGRDERRRKKRCDAHANGELLCGGGLTWDSQRCICKR